MKKNNKLFLSYLITLLIFTISSCSKENDVPSSYANMKNDKDIVVNAGDIFNIDLETNITSNSFAIGQYKIVWGSDTLNVEKYQTVSGGLQLAIRSKYSAVNKETAYPITIVDKATKQTISTGPKLTVIRTYSYGNALYSGSFAFPLLSMLLDKNGDIISLGGYSFSEVRMNSIKFTEVESTLSRAMFKLSPTILPTPPAIENYQVAEMSSTNLLYPNLDRNGVAIYGNNVYFNQRFQQQQPYDVMFAIVKYDGKTSSIYKEGQANGAFKNPVSHIVVDSKGTLYAVEYTIPGVYKLDKDKGKGIWVGSPTDTGSKDGQGLIAKFSEIVDMRIDQNDNIYTVEKTKIRKITPDGTVSTLIGTDEASDVDGDIKTTRFSDIRAISFDKANKLYIASKGVNGLAIKVLDLQNGKIVSLHIANPPQDIGSHNAMVVLDNGIIAFGFHAYNTINRDYEVAAIFPLDMMN